MRPWSARELKAFANRYLADRFRQGLPVRAQELAAKLGIQTYQFSNLFFRVVGERPAGFLKRLQVERAGYLLKKTNLAIDVIARKSGFGSGTTLHRSFRRITALTPTQYRRRAR